MPFASRNMIRPLPRKPHRRAPRRDISLPPPSTGSTLTAQLGGWAFQPKVYIAWDGPTTPNAGWIDVTPWVDVTQGIVINPGRADGLSDPNSTTCTFTVDNSDGRWIAGNPSGAWFGLIRKGAWIRVDVLPLSGNTSRRFTGYITSLPTTVTGQYSEAQITASDQFVPLTQAPKLSTMVIEEWMSDPEGSPYVAGYWPLHEPSGALYASDVSGQAPAGAQTLAIRSHGVSAGTGLTWSSVPGPGFDQVSTVAFAPTGTAIPAIGGGSTGALPNGSWLQGTIKLAACAQVTCWIQTTVKNQPIWSWSDPTSNYAFGIAIDNAGYLGTWQAPLSGFGAAYSANLGAGGQSNYPINDGAWHMVSIKFQMPAMLPGNEAYLAVLCDGIETTYWTGSLPSTPANSYCPAPNMSRFLLGAAEGWNGDVSGSGYCLFTGSISDFVVHLMPAPSVNPNTYSPYIASSTGHSGESTGLRLSRLVAYAGLPAPVVEFPLPNSLLPAYMPSLGTSTAVSIGATAHPAGVQTIAGVNPLDALRTVAHTENMPLFVDAFGRITLQASTIRCNPTPAVTITAEADLDPSTAWADDFQYMVNEVAITPSGQGQITVDSGGAASQALNGVYSTQIDTVSLNGAEAVSLGAAIIGAGASPPPRSAPLACEVATLAVQSRYGAAWYDSVLAMTISSVIEVQNWTAQSPYGAGGTSTHVIEGWAETIGEGQHLFAWTTSPVQGPTIQLDSPTLGRLDDPNLTLAY